MGVLHDGWRLQSRGAGLCPPKSRSCCGRRCFRAPTPATASAAIGRFAGSSTSGKAASGAECAFAVAIRRPIRTLSLLPCCVRTLNMVAEWLGVVLKSIPAIDPSSQRVESTSELLEKRALAQTPLDPSDSRLRPAIPRVQKSFFVEPDGISVRPCRLDD